MIPTPVSPLDTLPPVRAACLASIAIPASNEEAEIAGALGALVAQRGLDGRPLDPDGFEVVVFANNSRDATAAVVRDVAARHPAHAIHVVEDVPSGAPPHVGLARGAAMAIAARRMTANGRRGILATTDADTRVDARWLAATIDALARVDAVGGRIVPEAAREPIGRAALALDRHFKAAMVALECALDPVPWDPWPRHSNHQGASLALRAELYARVGGVPALATLEDLGLYRALVRDDARFRHDLAVRVTTSARRIGRIPGGYAGDLDALDAHVRGERPFLVQDPHDMALAFRRRGAVRALWYAPARARRALAARAEDALALDRAEIGARIAAASTAGRALAAFALDPRPRSAAARLVPIDEATAGLRAALARLHEARGLSLERA